MVEKSIKKFLINYWDILISFPVGLLFFKWWFVLPITIWMTLLAWVEDKDYEDTISIKPL